MNLHQSSCVSLLSAGIVGMAQRWDLVFHFKKLGARRINVLTVTEASAMSYEGLTSLCLSSL